MQLLALRQPWTPIEVRPPSLYSQLPWKSVNELPRSKVKLGVPHARALLAIITCATAKKRRPQRRCDSLRCRAQEDERALAQSLQERTLDSLDLDFVVDRLRSHCCTVHAAEICDDPANLLASSAEEARALYDEVVELSELEDEDLPLSASLDISAQVEECCRGSVLEPPDLADIADAIKHLQKLRMGLEGAVARGANIPSLLDIADRLELPDELLDSLLDAFDDKMELSAKKFPQIAEMKAKIKERESSCSTAMSQVLRSGKYRRYMTNDGYMQIGGRYVLSVRPQHKSEVGVTVDESRTGMTAYVEPTELVGLSGDLQQLQEELKFSIRRIIGQMCIAVSRSSDAIANCIEAAAEIDLARARLFLGEDMEGEVPEVRDEGVFIARQARNPCLLLRCGSVVRGYRLELGAKTQGLILSGPNAGGKTVVLKTIGLIALLARCGIPVPAGESPRVDFFEVVLAEVGDMQTIVDDLSTYSAHLVASRIMLGCVKESGPRSLVLVDEAGTGTDPAQGAALARAILEELLQRGARAVATTHCLQLKDWAASDPRTEIAAMEYKRGQPTFRLVPNSIGESHAIETARRLNLALDVVTRAEEFLSEDQRSLEALERKAKDLQSQLETQLERAHEREAMARMAAEDANLQAEALQQRQEKILALEVDLLERRERIQAQLAADHQSQMALHQQKVQTVIDELKRTSGKDGHDRLRIVGDAIEDLRVERDKVSEAEKRRAKLQKARSMPGALSPSDDLGIGEWVIVLAKTPWYGFKGRVQRLNGVKVLVALDGSGSGVELEKTELAKCSAPLPRGKKKNTRASGKVRDYSKLAW